MPPPPTWDPYGPAVFVESAPHDPRVLLVRHDGYPYHEDDWDESATGWDGLFDIANRYLALANARLNLPPEWLASLREDLGGGLPGALHWLRDRRDPRNSYWIERQAGLDDPSRPATGPVLDRTAVLLAGLCWALPGAWFPLYGGQGLKILVHAGPPSSGRATVRITGVRSTLPQATLDRIAPQLFERMDERIIDAFGLPKGVTLIDQGLRVPESPSAKEQSPIFFAKTVPPSDYDDEEEEQEHSRHEYSYDSTSYLLVMRVNPKWPGGLEPLVRQPLIASADADVFTQDPVSRNGGKDFIRLRSNRSWMVLDGEVVNVPLGTLPLGTNPALVQLVDPDPNTPPHPNFQVLNSRLVDPPLAETAPKEVPPSVHAHVRSNTFAAVSAFFHTSELFSRLRQYGLPLANSFRFVILPIDVRYRAGIIPGAGDGRTVNAQVRWTVRPNPAIKTIPTGKIEVRFALGDLDSAVGRLPANLPPAVERSPLGIAGDPRWCWHEFCHVLLAGSVGDLELRFAHSAGDAIAAILSDPDSELAYDQSGALSNDGPWRGVTFPWVFIPRRHDRRVQDGWGWTGPMNQPDVYFVVSGLSDKRGYWTEQILSSALFRLYRAIGGDSEVLTGGVRKAATAARGQAADYTVYLIMRAIELLGAAAVTPSTIPGDFVAVLKAADTATTTAPGPGGYVGGTVWKVVQWAFERQGLYGMPVPGSAVIGPDDPATVDLHIDDLRSKPDGPYSPVDLLGQAWHAHPNSLWVSASSFPWVRTRKIRVKVHNRGTAPASTEVEVWWAPLGGGPIPAFPDSTKWKSLGSKTATVPGRTGSVPGAKTFGPFTWEPPAGANDYAILAAATCAADRSNIDPLLLHPVNIAGPVNILVGCDNNLGLITVAIT